MSTLETDLVQAATGTNTALKLKGKGSGVVKLGDGELSFPDSDGSASQVLQTDGSGTLSFSDTLGGSSAELEDLYLADGAVIYFGDDQDITVTHDPDDGLFLKSTATADNNPFVLTLQTGETDMAADDIIGQIDFQAPDEGTGTDAILVASSIRAVSEGNFSSSSNATSLKLFTGNSAAAGSDGGSLILGSTGNLTLKDLRTADGSSPTVTLQSGDTDMAVDDVLGTINFQAPDEGTGTDAILVAAGISAISEGDFSSSSSATKLSFKTASSAAAAETMFLGSSGNLQVSSEVSAESFNLPITLNGTDGSSTDAGDNIVLDASAASTNVGERLLYEGIPETAITALGGSVAGADNQIGRVNLIDYGEITNAIGSVGGGAQTINLTLGNSVSATIDTSTTTFAFSNPTASGAMCAFSLVLKNGGSQTVNWPGSVDWAGGTAPTLTSSGVDILVFITIDGGTIWHGMAASTDSK